MDNPVLQIAMRYLHIVSAVALVGGMVFISLALRPAMRLLEGPQREAVQNKAHDAFLRVVYWCMAGLVISGAYNWYMLNDAYNAIRPWGQMLIGIKTLLALIAFAIVWGRSIGLIKLPGKVCHMINLHLAAAVILLGAILRYLRTPTV